MPRRSAHFLWVIRKVRIFDPWIQASAVLTGCIVKEVYYPKYNPTKAFYDACRCPNGGYGGLLSITFHFEKDAMLFYDNLATAKGPSLGTNFTLVSPYTLLAHYGELEWVCRTRCPCCMLPLTHMQAKSFGVEASLVRVSIGLEEPPELTSIFENALKLIQEV